jgi:hypothetical protein
MKRIVLLVFGLLVTIGVRSAASKADGTVHRPLTVVPVQADECPATRRIVEIRNADPATNAAQHRAMRDLFITSARTPNTTVVLGPTVVLDFSSVPADSLPIVIGRCVTIRSVARFATTPDRPDLRDEVRDPRLTTSTAESGSRSGSVAREGRVNTDTRGEFATEVLDERQPAAPIPSGRSSTSRGPLLKFGPHRSAGDMSFLQARCYPENEGQSDHIVLTGFRVYGPSFGQQQNGDRGIVIIKCVDVEISNLEVAGWGGEAIKIQDEHDEYPESEWNLRGQPSVCHEPPHNGPGGRIASADQVRIVDNYIHHNQQPRTTFDNHTGGYGVQVTYGAYATVARNLFSHNRHAVEGGGNMGGYDAIENLVLRYGGIHYDGAITVHTHQFDIHGTGDNGFGGFAGARTRYSYNAFQYGADNAIAIRGSPRCGIDISHNVFPHEGLEDDWGDDAIKLEYRDDIGRIKLGPSNTINYNSYGKYAVCDFDGDAIDDLFLPTGVSWWFSGMGEFPWRFLSQRTERLERLRFGYFDGDNKCDVVTESNGAWMISSGGTGAWYRLGQAYAPLNQIHFGRFDPSVRDGRAGATKRTTHAFWRTPQGEWKITTLTGAGQGWRPLGSSRVPMNELAFGDFTGDGVTDVLSVQRGRWAISKSGAETWTNLNPSLGDNVAGLKFADIDHNGIDDIIRLRYSTLPFGTHTRERYEWEVSYDGAGTWKPLKSYAWVTPGSFLARNTTIHVFAGRFGLAPGAGILTVDRGGTGRFFAPLEGRERRSTDWNSTFNY